MPPRRTSSVIAIVAASARSDSSAPLAALYCESLKTRSLRRLQRAETISGRHNTDTARPSVCWRSSSNRSLQESRRFFGQWNYYRVLVEIPERKEKHVQFPVYRQYVN